MFCVIIYHEINMVELTGSKLWVINFYREQLSKLLKIGLGRRTEFGVLVTEELIKTTENRLAKLAVVYDRNIIYHVQYQRRLKEKNTKGHTNGQASNTSGSTIKT